MRYPYTATAVLVALCGVAVSTDDVPEVTPTPTEAREKTAYEMGTSATGSVLSKGMWQRRLFRGRKRAIEGDTEALDYVWLGNSATYTADKVRLSLFSREAGAVLPHWSDGVMGIHDVSKGSFMGALFGNSKPEQARKEHLYAVSFGKYVAEKKKFAPGVFQFEGYDTGTFSQPDWTAVKDQDVTDLLKCSSCLELTGLYVNNVPLFAENPDDKEGLPKIDSLPASLRSAHPAISLPNHLLKRLEAAKIAIKDITKIALTFSGGVTEKGVKFAGFTVHLSEEDLLRGLKPDITEIPSDYQGVTGQDDPDTDGYHIIILGAPFFRAGNVVFETKAKVGVRQRIGFATRRKDVGPTEEFKAVPIDTHAGYGLARVAIGGPEGKLQLDFNMMLDTNYNGFSVAQGKHVRGLGQLPAVGSFYQACFVLLVVLPFCIGLVLRQAHKAAQDLATASIRTIRSEPDIELAALRDPAEVNDERRGGSPLRKGKRED